MFWLIDLFVKTIDTNLNVSLDSLYQRTHKSQESLSKISMHSDKVGSRSHSPPTIQYNVFVNKNNSLGLWIFLLNIILFLLLINVKFKIW